MTLRLRVTLITFSVVLLSLLAFAGLAGSLLWRAELSSITQQVTAQSGALLTIARDTPERLSDEADDLLERDGVTAVARVYRQRPGQRPLQRQPRGRVLWSGGASGPETLDPAFLGGRPARTLRRVGDYLVVSRREGGVMVQTGRNLRPLIRLMQRYALVAAASTLLLSALAGLVIAWEMRRTLRPLERLAAGVGHLENRRPLPGLGEPGEVGALARALDTSLGALRAERERETLFLAAASHELRTPVTAMLADLQHTLSRERSAPDVLAALRRTERTAARLRSLTGNLMTLTRAQRLPARAAADRSADRSQADLPLADLLDLAGEAVDLLQPLATAHAVDLWLDGAPCPVQGDGALLSSVLENLIGNALKFTPPGGHVRVLVLPGPGGAAQLSVEDTGPGFPGGALTDAFVRGQTGTGGTRTEGFGLGLAVVRQVVEAHQGSLYLGQRPGGGARVEVTLP